MDFQAAGDQQRSGLMRIAQVLREAASAISSSGVVVLPARNSATVLHARRDERLSPAMENH